jgi:hypothetical protein
MRCIGQFDRCIGCRSLTIHRVKSVLLAESWECLGASQDDPGTVPLAVFDCVNELQFID